MKMNIEKNQKWSCPVGPGDPLAPLFLPTLSPKLEQKKISPAEQKPQEDPKPVPISPPKPGKNRHGWLLIPAAVLAVFAIMYFLKGPMPDAPPVSMETTPDQTQSTVYTETTTEETRHREISAEDLVLQNFDVQGTSYYTFGTNIQKNNVVSIEFLDSLEGHPEDAVDVSETGNGKVLLWSEPYQGDYLQKKLFIAGDGKVILPKCSAYLFGGNGRSYVKYASLQELSFGNAVDTSQVTDMEGMFSGCGVLQMLDVTHFNTAHVTSMDRMFSGCSSLRELDVTNFDTSQVTDMEGVFLYCSSLQALDVTNFNTSQVTNMDRMFSGCSSLQALNVESFNTSQVSNMGEMFSHCKSLKVLDLRAFNTSQVTDMGCMFDNCTSLRRLDLSSFDTSNVVNVVIMFLNCDSLTEENLITKDEKVLQEFRKRT